MNTRSLRLEGRQLWRIAVAATSLVATPLLVFLSSSIALYRTNAEELFFRNSVLMPFMLLFAGSLTAACCIFFLLRKNRQKYFLWFYYLLGPLFIVYSLINDSPLPSAINYLLFSLIIVVVLWLVVVLNRRINLQDIVGYIALVSLALILLESYNFSTTLRAEMAAISQGSREHRNGPAGIGQNAANLPNVYHLVFDEYQSDMFFLTLSPEVRDELGGFAFFPEATTLFGRTRMSLASMFLGREYDLNSSQLEFQRAAYRSEDSILSLLKKEGYRTEAYVHQAFMKTLERSLFDEVICQQDYFNIASEDVDALFFRLWIYSFFPDFLAAKLADEDELIQLEAQNLIGRSGAIISVHAWRRFLNEERLNPSGGRYVFAHLMVPHIPYILDENCDYGSEDEESTPLEQSLCATRLIVDFVEMLKATDRYRESLIIIQGDHGARFEVDGGTLKSLSYKGAESVDWIKARARTLLMIKPAGVAATESLTISPAEATLLDVAPSIVSCLGLETDTEFEGTSVVNPVAANLVRIRYFFFFDKKARYEWTDAVNRYRIEGADVFFEGSVSIKNNPDPNNPHF